MEEDTTCRILTTSFEATPLWRIVDEALRELESNQDLEITTASVRHRILCQELSGSGALPTNVMLPNRALLLSNAVLSVAPRALRARGAFCLSVRSRTPWRQLASHPSQTDLYRARSTIGDDRRVYSDEEFALILRKAAELAEPADTSSRSSGGLTLAEMKAAAAQVGIDPALVERAARLLTANATAAPSFLERLFGGRARYSGEAHFPIVLDEASVAQLMSAIRIGVGRPGEGHSSALGLTWRSWDDGGSVLSLTAQADHESTSVTAELDRRPTLAIVASMTGVGCFMAVFFGGTLAGELVPGFEPAGALLGLVSVLAVARSYWGSSTRTARDRLSRVMDSVSRFLTRPGNVTSRGERAAPARTESDPARDAS